jgi:hypothetical protein
VRDYEAILAEVLACLQQLETDESLWGASHRRREQGLPSNISLHGRTYIHNQLSVKHLHARSAAKVHEYSLKLSIGTARVIR